MSKQELKLIEARLEVSEDGAKAWCCGVPGCTQVLATVLPSRPEQVRHIKPKSGGVRAITRDLSQECLEVSDELQELDPEAVVGDLWGDPNSPGVRRHFPDKRSAYIDRRNEEKRL